MAIKELFKVTQRERHKFCSFIIDSSAPKPDFYFLVLLSSLIVTLGLLSDNVILVIGGMLVTPILSPLLAIALGVVINDGKVILRSVRIFLTAFALAFLMSLILGFVIDVNLTSVALIQIMEPSLLNFFIAFIAGIAASYTWAKPGLDETLPGIAVTVALIPPLTALGLTIANANWALFDDVYKVFLLNIFGIIIASLIIFSLMDFYKAKKKLVEEFKQEKKEIKQSKKTKK